MNARDSVFESFAGDRREDIEGCGLSGPFSDEEVFSNEYDGLDEPEEGRKGTEKPPNSGSDDTDLVQTSMM